MQELLFERDVAVSHQAIHKWCRKLGEDYANRLRRRRLQPGDTWHVDEVFLTIHGCQLDTFFVLESLEL
jgi:putative transposase